MYYIQSEFRRKDGKETQMYYIHSEFRRKDEMKFERSLRKKPEKVLFAIDVDGKPTTLHRVLVLALLSQRSLLALRVLVV